MDLSNLGVAAIPAIVVICYFFSSALKLTPLDNKYLPVICMILGGILGVAETYVNPGTITTDFFSSLAIGIVSGVAATSVKQIITNWNTKCDSSSQTENPEQN